MLDPVHEMASLTRKSGRAQARQAGKIIDADYPEPDSCPVVKVRIGGGRISVEIPNCAVCQICGIPPSSDVYH